MSRKFKYNKNVDVVEDIDLEFHLHNYQKEDLSNLLETLMKKYENNGSEYSNGVVDGLNHAYKVVNGISDDYLSGIKEK